MDSSNEEVTIPRTARVIALAQRIRQENTPGETPANIAVAQTESDSMLQAPANAEGASRFGGVMDAVKSWIYGQPAQPTEAPEPEKKEDPKDPNLTTEQNSKSAPAPPPP